MKYRPTMPCQDQDILTLLALVAERMNGLEPERLLGIAETLKLYGEETYGPEGKLLKRFARLVKERAK